MATNKLTELAIKKAKPKEKSYKISDGGGLYLEVMPNGSKYWRMKYRFGGKEKRLAFGVYPLVTLASARENARLAKLELLDGNDPGEIKRQEKLERKIAVSNTFDAIAAEFIKKKEIEGAAPVTLDKLKWLVEQKLSPYIGKTPVSQITSAKLLVPLRQIEADGLHETASRAKRVAGQIMRYAVGLGLAERDPSFDLKDALVIAKTNHRAAITDPKELRKILISIDSYTGSPEINAALKLTPMLFQRPGEIRQMEWSEINWEQEYWEIPAEKMKMRFAHIVPLPKQALKILEGLKPITGRFRYVMPSAKRDGRPMSDNGVRSALRLLGYTNDQVTPHGFRATARTILDEVLHFRVDYIEQQLAHAVKDTNGRAYNRTKHLPERKAMMQAWADYLEELRVKKI
jgi:integrase